MKYLSNNYIKFFKELAANNNSEWFNQNRKRYENDVKIPFQRLVADVLEELAKSDKNLVGTKFSDCIFRINRDIRFSKDKTPYKLHMAAAFAPGGKKNMDYPGFYFEISPVEVNIYAGVYMPSKTQLETLRKHIATNLITFEKLIKTPDFIDKFYGGILGEKQKRIEPSLKIAAEKQPLIYNKQFYVKASLAESLITNENLPLIFKEYYDCVMPLCTFLYKAIT